MDTTYEIVLPPPPSRPSLTGRIRRKLVRTMFGETAPHHVVDGWPAMPYPTVELVYWRPAGQVNFGDELSRTVVELMLARQGFTVFDELKDRRRMLAIGSVLHFAENSSIVWGSGLNGSIDKTQHRYTTLDVRAVRGPITRQFLMRRGIDVPEIYGDPALLINRLTSGRFASAKPFKVAIVPHMSEMQHPELVRYRASPEFLIIDPRRSWNCVVKEIAGCEFVISSSLHGLIVADAYGIPSMYVRLSDKEGLLKYEDYYAGTGRSLHFVKSVDEALHAGGRALSDFDPNRLLNAFPYDIWSANDVFAKS